MTRKMKVKKRNLNWLKGNGGKRERERERERERRIHIGNKEGNILGVDEKAEREMHEISAALLVKK